jgi:hypothetical protein
VRSTFRARTLLRARPDWHPVLGDLAILIEQDAVTENRVIIGAFSIRGPEAIVGGFGADEVAILGPRFVTEVGALSVSRREASSAARP